MNESTDGLEHCFSVAMDPAAVDSMIIARLTEIQRTAHFKGFRRGKAPLGLVRSHCGRVVQSAVVDRVAVEIARKIIADKRLQPISRPSITVHEGSDQRELEFTLSLEVFPDVTIGPLDQLSVLCLNILPDEAKMDKSADDRLALNQDTAYSAAELQQFARMHIKQQVFDQLMKKYDFPVPTVLTEREYERIITSYKEQFDETPSSNVCTEFRPIAERRIRLAILLAEIGRKHNIQIPRNEVERLVELQAERDPEHEAEIVTYYLEHPSALAELQSPVFEDRVIDFILEQCKTSEQTVSLDEFFASTGIS